MKFNKKVEKFNKKKRRRERFESSIEENIWLVIDKIRAFKRKRELKRDIKNLEKLKKKSLDAMINKVEEDLLRYRPGQKIYVYKDAELEYKVRSVKHAFTNSWLSSCPICLKYHRTMQHLEQEVDFDYFYNEIYKYFSAYDDLEVKHTIDKTWEKNQVIASELECFYVVRTDENNKED